MLRALVATIAVLTAMVAGPATPARADVSAECWNHLAGVKTATTPAADRRFHLGRGEPSPCTETDAQQSSNNNSSTKSEEYHSESKSRYCKKRWFC